ncbi:MAG: ribonuclease HI [bacterium]|nr:ribonuclease HI [bacterium]
MANKFFIVTKGRKPGIYKSWMGDEGAKAQVDKFPGAQYKSFQSKSDAEQWLKQIGSTSSKIKAELNQLKSANGTRSGIAEPDFQTDIQNGKIVIFTDGASHGNPGPGGYGVVLFSNGKRKERSGGYQKTTNNRMELTACIQGLEATSPGSSIVLYCDSKYVINGLDKGWAKKWRANNWMKNRTEPALNPDLWANLLELYEARNVELRWLKGHAGIEENEVCDRLATQAAQGSDLPVDEGFLSKQTPSLFDFM